MRQSAIARSLLPKSSNVSRQFIPAPQQLVLCPKTTTRKRQVALLIYRILLLPGNTSSSHMCTKRTRLHPIQATKTATRPSRVCRPNQRIVAWHTRLPFPIRASLTCAYISLSRIISTASSYSETSRESIYQATQPHSSVFSARVGSAARNTCSSTI